MRPLVYVILHHQGIAAPHYDLMFETLPGSELATWRSPIWPIESRASITRLKDHRRLYLDYEGDLSGRRGRVERVAHGQCEITVGEDACWTLRLLNGVSPMVLTMRQVQDERWEAAAV